VQTVRRHTLGSAQTRAVVLDGLTGLHEALLQRNAALARARMEQFMADAESAYFSSIEAGGGELTPARRADRASRLETQGVH
jgi:hypothetical protein